MATASGTTHTPAAHHLFDEQLDALKSGVRKLIIRVTDEPVDEPAAEAVAAPGAERSRLRAFSAKATGLVKAHPIAAVGIAAGAGYLVMRLVRR